MPEIRNIAPDRLPRVLRTVGECADALGLEAYVVGGYVRDLLLGRPSKDIDFVTVGSGIALARKVADTLGPGTHFSFFKTYGTAQVKRGRLELEFVGARKESYHHDSRNPIVEDGTLHDDISRRDFTVNALAICVNGPRFGELVDLFGGVDDMRKGILRTPLDPDVTFSDDPLRMLRAVRFATQLSFDIFPATLDAITRNAQRIKIITGERIITELNKVMSAPRPSVGWKLLDRTGLLQLIFPELAALKGVETVEGRGHKDNFLHTLQVLDNVAAKSDDLWLRWAALLHDIGKPQTKRWDPETGWTFHNHNFIGAKMVPRIFRRLKLPVDARMELVRKLVDLHMRPIALVEDTVTDSAIRRVLFDAGDDIDRLMTLCEADITSKNEAKVARILANFAHVRDKMAELEERDRIRCFQPPVRGEEIMATFGLGECRTVGVIKEAIKDAILDGLIHNDHAEARAFMLAHAATLGLTPLTNA